MDVYSNQHSDCDKTNNQMPMGNRVYFEFRIFHDFSGKARHLLPENLYERDMTGLSENSVVTVK